MINVRGTALEQQCYCPNSDQTCLNHQTMMLPKNPCVGRCGADWSLPIAHSSRAALLCTAHADYDTRHTTNATSTMADLAVRLSTAADSLLAIVRHSLAAGCCRCQWSTGWCRRRRIRQRRRRIRRRQRRYTATVGRPVCSRSVNGNQTARPVVWHVRGVCDCRHSNYCTWPTDVAECRDHWPR